MGAQDANNRKQGNPGLRKRRPARKRKRIWSKSLVWMLCLLPLARLIWKGFHGGLGANPIEFITLSTGTWTLVLLLATLSITPLRKLTRQAWLIRYRRVIGLFAFFYGVLHFICYIWLDKFFDFLDQIFQVTGTLLGAAVEINNLAEASFSGAEAKVVLNLIKGLGEEEWKADRMARSLSKDVYSLEKELDPITIIFYEKMILTLSGIANAAENAGDMLRLMIIK